MDVGFPEQQLQRDIIGRGIKDRRVIAALKSVPRENFVPANLRGRAYDDSPLPIGDNQTISQPYVVAFMTELLKIAPGDKVLEVGTGSGYQAAVLAELGADVYTIEIIESLHDVALQRLRAYDLDEDRVRLGSGHAGIPEHAPYDAIIVTAAPHQIPRTLVEQLKTGGRMVVPVGPVHEAQSLLLVHKNADGTIKTSNVLPVRFVPMTS